MVLGSKRPTERVAAALESGVYNGFLADKEGPEIARLQANSHPTPRALSLLGVGTATGCGCREPGQATGNKVAEESVS